jgi:prevent-host-death family protein
MQNHFIAAREAKNHFGELLDNAQREPIIVTKKNRPVVVVISVEEYQKMIELPQKHTNFNGWLNYANKAPLNPNPQSHSDDDLWS